MKKQPSGKFVVFEGLDGSGQSTQVALLADFLKNKGYNVLVTKEPTRESPAAQEIRLALEEKQNLSPRKLQELFVEDRRWHLEKIVCPFLQESDKNIVISDRYFFSTLAFGSSDSLDEEWLAEINKDFLLPDILFFMDTKPETAIKRIEQRGEAKQLFERLEKLTVVYQNYQRVLKRFENKITVVYLHGERSIKEIFDEIKSKINI